MINQAFWEKLGPKLQETVLQLWAENLPAYRARHCRVTGARRGTN